MKFDHKIARIFPVIHVLSVFPFSILKNLLKCQKKVEHRICIFRQCLSNAIMLMVESKVQGKIHIFRQIYKTLMLIPYSFDAQTKKFDVRSLLDD